MIFCSKCEWEFNRKALEKRRKSNNSEHFAMVWWFLASSSSLKLIFCARFVFSSRILESYICIYYVSERKNMREISKILWSVENSSTELWLDRMCALWEAVGCRVEFTLLADLVYLLSSSPSLGFKTSSLRTFLARYRSCVCRTVIGTNNFNIYSKLFALSSSSLGEGERQKAEPFMYFFLRWYERSRPRPHHHHHHQP